jgi:hypothetical protein
VERQPFEPERPQPQERQNFQPRQDRRDARPERGPRPDRPFGDRQEGRREFRPYRDPAQRDQPAPEGAPAAALPSFITSGPRLTNPAEESEQPTPPPNVAVVEGSEPAEALPPRADHDQPQPDGRFPRGRRRRLRSPYGLYAQGNAEEGQTPPLPPEDTPVSE